MSGFAATKRQFKDIRGRRWAFLSRDDIPDLHEPWKTYLTRWRIIQTPWFGLFLHRIALPDRDRHLHDHPWSFATLILSGGYREVVPVGDDPAGSTVSRTWRTGSIHRLIAEEFHSIAVLHRKPTWTLVFVGPRRRDWGFGTAKGWVDHQTYIAQRDGGVR